MLHLLLQRLKGVSQVPTKVPMLRRIPVRVGIAKSRFEWGGHKLPIDHPWDEIVTEDCPKWSMGGKPCTLHDVERNEPLQQQWI